MIENICKAFCDMITWRKVPCGYAVTTPFRFSDGDPIVFFIVKVDQSLHRLEDDGTQVPALEASGVDVGTGSRADAFNEMLSEYELHFDSEARVICSADLTESEVPIASLKFIAALLRLQDFLLLHPVIVRNTFREDAVAAIHASFDQTAMVAENAAISEQLAGYMADVVIGGDRPMPIAIYLGTSNERALIALVVKMETEKYQVTPCRVILLVEHAKRNPLHDQTYALAQARLDNVLSFRGVERDSMTRIGGYLQ
jgi:hypothetical protein